MKVTILQATDLLKNAMTRRKPVALIGPPGCAKSALVMQVAKSLDYDYKVFHPVTSDPTDFKGLPWPNSDKGTADFLPYGEFASLLNATKPTVAHFDDLGHATKAVQGTLMQPFHARSLNAQKIPDCVTFVMASNRREDRAGVEGIIEPLLSRCHGVYDIQPDIESFQDWWMKNDKPAEVLAFLRFRPDLLFVTEKKHAMYNFPCFRTWEACGDWLTSGVSKLVEKEAYCGAVGEGAGTEFFAFLKIFRELPDLEDAIAYPEKVDIPKSPSILWAFTTALAYRSNKKTFSSIAVLIDRLMNDGKEEQAVYLFQGAVLKCDEVSRLADFAKLATNKRLKKYIIV